jgi:hypothetical protein
VLMSVGFVWSGDIASLGIVAWLVRLFALLPLTPPPFLPPLTHPTLLLTPPDPTHPQVSSACKPGKTYPDTAPAADLIKQHTGYSAYTDCLVLHQLAVDCPPKTGGSVYAGGSCVQSAPETFVRWVGGGHLLVDVWCLCGTVMSGVLFVSLFCLFVVDGVMPFIF